MANLNAPINIYPYSSWYLQQRSVYNFNTTNGSGNYIHFKTNIHGSTDSMYMIEAVGYNYSSAAPIRCAWGFYCYNGALYTTGVANIYSGMSADGMYMSSDNYVTIRTYSGTYFIGFTLNVYACRLDTTHYNVTPLAV